MNNLVKSTFKSKEQAAAKGIIVSYNSRIFTWSTAHNYKWTLGPHTIVKTVQFICTVFLLLKLIA